MATESQRVQVARQKLDDADNPLQGLTYTQAETWIDNNVTDMAGAAVAFKKVARRLIDHEARLAYLESLVKKRLGD